MCRRLIVLSNNLLTFPSSDKLERKTITDFYARYVKPWDVKQRSH